MGALYANGRSKSSRRRYDPHRTNRAGIANEAWSRAERRRVLTCAINVDINVLSRGRNRVPVGRSNKDAAHPGLSAFYKDAAGDVFHTYSGYARGPEELIGTFMILDRAPKGRDEKTIMDWVRRHDEYEEAPRAPSCCAS